MNSYKNIRSDRQWRGTIGLTEAKFEILVQKFQTQYESKNGISLSEGASNLKLKLLLPTYENCVFFVLFQLKNSLNYDSLGLLINTDASNARTNFEKYLVILNDILIEMGVMPKRSFNNIEEFESYFSAIESLLIDASEQAINRPQGKENQENMYSAKKRNIRIKS